MVQSNEALQVGVRNLQTQMHDAEQDNLERYSKNADLRRQLEDMTDERDR
jgi:hypothetical protein